MRRLGGLIVSVALLPGCGVIGLGGNPYLLEGVPDGTLVYQGTLTTLNSAYPTTGVAQVYRGTSGDVIRLTGLSAPTSVGPLSIIGNGQQSGITKTYTSTLRSARGDQNYDTGLSTVIWSTVSIRNAASPSSQPYGTATLQAVLY